MSMTNFESALLSGARTDPQPKQYAFHAPPAALTAFKYAHVTLVTEANNYGEDCGRPGLAQTLAIAKAAHYPVIGIGANAAQAFTPYRKTINGQRIAIRGHRGHRLEPDDLVDGDRHPGRAGLGVPGR